MDAREFVKHVISESNNQDILNIEEVKQEAVADATNDENKKKKKKRNPTEKEELAKLVPEDQMISPIPNRSFLKFNHV